MRHSLIAWTLFAVIAVPAAPEEPPRLTVEAIFAADATGRRPAQLAWSPDGRRLTYVWSEQADGKDEALWSLDPATGKRQILVRPGDLGTGDEEPKLDAYVWSPRGSALLLAAKGDLYLLPLDTRKPRRLTNTEEDEEDASFSPDGSRIAFVRGFDLYAIDVATGRE